VIHPRKPLGALLYLFVVLPAMLGGMATLSLSSWAAKPDAYKALVTDARFAAVLESPELSRLAPDSFQAGGYTLEGPAAVKAAQAAIPTRTVVDTLTRGIDAAFASIASGTPSLAMDLAPFKQALKDGADAAAEAYLFNATDPQKLLPKAALPEGTRPSALSIAGSADAQSAMAELVRRTADSLPDLYVATENPRALPGEVQASTMIGLARIVDLGFALSRSALWLSLVAAGLWVASAFLSETELRKRLGTMGRRILGPGSVFLGVGLLPHLVNPSALATSTAHDAIAGFPALSEYARFVFTSLTGGALVVGLVAVGLGTALVSAKRAIPPSADYEDGEES